MKITTDKFISIEAEDGYKLTRYQEGEDILNFSSFTKGAFPLTFDTSVIREITIEEAENLEQAKEAAIEAAEKEQE